MVGVGGYKHKINADLAAFICKHNLYTHKTHNVANAASNSSKCLILGGACSGLGAVVQGLFHVNVLLSMPVGYLIVILWSKGEH